jgi:hypothetical protein
VVDIEKRLYTWSQASTSGADGYSSGQLGMGDNLPHRKPTKVCATIEIERVFFTEVGMVF